MTDRVSACVRARASDRAIERVGNRPPGKARDLRTVDRLAVSTPTANRRGKGDKSAPFTSQTISIFKRPDGDRDTAKSGRETKVVIEIVEFQEFVVPVLSHRLSGSTYRRGPDIRLLLVIPEEGLVVDGVVGHIEFLVSPRVGTGRCGPRTWRAEGVPRAATGLSCVEARTW